MAFQFVVSSGPKVPTDPALRTMIRKQAMKDVALERRKRSQAYRATRKQSDDSLVQTSSSSSRSSSLDSSPAEESPVSELVRWQSSSSDELTDWSWDDMQATFFSSIIPNPLSPYEQVCTKHNVTLDDLSGLTMFGICSPVVPALSDPKILNTLLGHKTHSYLRFVPNKYGKVRCITAAVDCVLAKAACRTKDRSRKNDALATSLYSIALREVQSSIRNESRWKDPDVMCAIMLLLLYELLDSTREEGFQQHVSGLSDLAKHRKANGFVSDYDLALLYGTMGSIMLESVLIFEKCYLAEPEWQAAIMRIAEDTTWLTQRSRVTVRIRLAETHLPGLLGDVNRAVNDRTAFGEGREDLLQRVEWQHQELLDCLDMFRAHLMQVSLLQPPQRELDLRRELLGSMTEHLCIMKRTLAILSDGDRPKLEAENRALCHLLDEIASQPGPKYAWLFNSHENSIVEGIRLTQEQWAQDFYHLNPQEQEDARVNMWRHYFADLSKMTTEDLDVGAAYSRMLQAASPNSSAS